MKNPYVFGNLPFLTTLLFSLTFGIYSVGFSIDIFKEVGLYAGLNEFLTDVQIRFSLLIVFIVIYFMVFAALKLIAETVHETAMFFFAKTYDLNNYRKLRSGNLIYFFGALLSIAGIQSLLILVAIFLGTTLIYALFILIQLGKELPISNVVGIIVFEVVVWALLVSLVTYSILKLYNGIMESLPFIGEEAIE